MRAILVAADFDKHDFQESLSELALLASAAGFELVRTVTGKRSKPDAALFTGADKTEEVKVAADEEDAKVIVLNHVLGPAQQRSLEHFFGRHAVDRTGLILDIFNQRARSHIGKVQVELVRVRYRAARLIRAWSHLECQKGGVGLHGGLDERQLELDRQVLNERAKRPLSGLDKLQRQYDTQRRSRSRNDAFSVSLVGHTSTDKSTLFNALTRAHTYAVNQLFTTLDTTSRRLYLEGLGNVVLSDTVDFIRDLSTQLMATLRTTLEETVHADVLLHVVDAASTVKHKQIEQVDHVLDEIDASGIPQVLMVNKIDAMEELRVIGPRIERDEIGAVQRMFVSTIEGTGLDLLREALVETMIRLREHPASYGGDFDLRFDARRDSLPTHRDELSQSSPSNDSSAKSDEEG